MKQSNRSQGFIILLAVVGILVLAFGIPFIMAGERPEIGEDIIIVPRFTATITPLYMALTRDAYAALFFTPANSPVVTLTKNNSK